MFSKPCMCRIRGCRYFGADFFDGYCSLCYRLHQGTELDTEVAPEPEMEPKTEPKMEPETEPKPSGESETDRASNDFIPEGAGPYYSSSAGRLGRVYRKERSRCGDLRSVGTMASSSGDVLVPRCISHSTIPRDVSHLNADDWWVSVEPSGLSNVDFEWRCPCTALYLPEDASR